MILTTRMQQANRGSQFRAYSLHGTHAISIDPFLGVDHAWMSAPTFPPHPHAGFSAVTYLFLDSETGIANHDSLGNSTLIQPGGLHWTAAGQGVIHEENPAVSGSTTHLLQIFVNLPTDKQEKAPFMLSIAPNDVPVVQKTGIRIRIPFGSFGGISSPLIPPTNVTLLDISMDAGAELDLSVAAGEQAFIMPIFGGAEIEGVKFNLENLIVPIIEASLTDSTYKLVAKSNGTKIAVFIGKPLQQSVISNGPMAFASQKSLTAATVAYQRGDFGRL
ncbi:pirin family protein [Acinetobacter baumannii]|uniref:pirin family protein n=1 Tax=Acinetobacter baumannii TaxID=470 RepID=UPI001BCC35EF|nr:pirin family protein [Acinetobacter baumannii]EKW4939620.1 pirin family protein [Acinetobacter baumannii]ELS4599056.1 pirin family protein [Acinetobacter baumannii]MCA4304077.1 pirin family protein [Acinetobacter baumannii]